MLRSILVYASSNLKAINNVRDLFSDMTLRKIDRPEGPVQNSEVTFFSDSNIADSFKRPISSSISVVVRGLQVIQFLNIVFILWLVYFTIWLIITSSNIRLQPSSISGFFPMGFSLDCNIGSFILIIFLTVTFENFLSAEHQVEHSFFPWKHFYLSMYI